MHTAVSQGTRATNASGHQEMGAQIGRSRTRLARERATTGQRESIRWYPPTTRLAAGSRVRWAGGRDFGLLRFNETPFSLGPAIFTQREMIVKRTGGIARAAKGAAAAGLPAIHGPAARIVPTRK